MKHIKLSIVVISVFVIGIAGCKKTLDQPILGFYSPDNFFTTDANAQFAVNAAYSPLMFSSGTDNPLWVVGDVASDDAIKGGSAGDQARHCQAPHDGGVASGTKNGERQRPARDRLDAHAGAVEHQGERDDRELRP